MNMVRPSLRRGSSVNVTVLQHIQEAGLLVRLPDGRHGFVHYSELTRPATNYVPGKSFTASVLDDNPETGRVALTTVSLDWRTLKDGQQVTGRVVTVGDKLVFVDIGAEINARIHISQLSDSYIQHPRDVVQVGQEIEARVESVNIGERRVDLSRRSRRY